MESAGGRIINEAALLKLINFMISSPTEFVRQAKELFARYESASTQYSRAVADELARLLELMELLPALVEEHWDRIRLWLFGSRRIEAERFLARACENQAELSSRVA
jgi:predicted sugar kinase